MGRPLNAERLELVYQETVDGLYRYVARRTGGDRQLSEDVVQETYLRAVRSWDHDGVAAEPLAWLRTVARNLLVSHFRRNRPSDVDPASLDRTLDGASVDSAETAALLHWGLARLDATNARLVEAFHLDGRSTRHVAEETGLTERAVEARLHRARRDLRAILAPHVIIESDSAGDAS